MVARKYIGIKFIVGYTFATGAVIYLMNMIRCLKLIKDELKPILVIFYTPESPVDDIKAIDYPYVEYVKLTDTGESKKPPLFVRLVNKLFRIVGGKNVLKEKFQYEPYQRTLDCVYDLYAPNPLFLIHTQRQICWIADFQHRYFPDYFSTDEYKGMENGIQQIIDSSYEVAFSSQDCTNDFLKFYTHSGSSIHLLRFVSILPDVSHFSGKDIKAKYNLTDKKYFIVSNQFWPHKNHLTVLKAIVELKNKYNLKDVNFVFTGHLSSHRQPEYSRTLENYIQKNELSSTIHFLGLIPREEQIVLIKNSLAVVQPSLFEGWSTIVEDVKALNHFIILSDLRIHREQMTYSQFDNHLFFQPYMHEELALHCKYVYENKIEIKPIDYKRDVEKYVDSLQAMFGI